MYRFHPQTEQVRQLAQGGAVGDIRIIRATFGFLLGPEKDIRWGPEMAAAAARRGVLLREYRPAMAGSEVCGSHGAATWAPTGVDQSVVGTLEFAGGVLATVDCSFATGHDQAGETRDLGKRGPDLRAEALPHGRGRDHNPGRQSGHTHPSRRDTCARRLRVSAHGGALRGCRAQQSPPRLHARKQPGQHARAGCQGSR